MRHMPAAAALTRAVVGALAVGAIGCATTAPPQGPSSARLGTPASAAAAPGFASAPSSASPSAITGVRSRTSTTGADLLESTAGDLSAAIARHAAEGSVESEIRLAQAFMRHGVLDKASELFAEASRRDPREGAAWDGLARVWRDWGFPQFGLGDAYRAVYAAPGSPIARNTLGTLLLALGRREDARAQFAHAAALDPTAAYAWNNLCYAWLLDGKADSAVASCSRALAADPGLGPAARNRALAAMLADRASAAGQPAATGVDHDRR